jgi:predicted RNA binding protein YcfA (HicA-like mRNA interferase family)
MTEKELEDGLIARLKDLKYCYRSDIDDRSTLEENFRKKFEALNRVKLTDGEFARLLDEIITPDVFAAAKILRSINAFSRDDGWFQVAQRENHRQFIHLSKSGRVTIAGKPSDELAKGTQMSILKQAGLRGSEQA